MSAELTVVPPAATQQAEEPAPPERRKPQRSARERTTDIENAQRFVLRHGADIHHCWPQGAWYLWDGRRWAKDDRGKVIELAKGVMRQMLEAAKKIHGENRTGWMEAAMRCQSMARLNAMLALSRSVTTVPVLPEDLDADHWKLNVANGTLDLKTGKLLQHDRSNLITKLAPVVWDEKAVCPRWMRFLDEITGENEELQTFLQRVVGYALTGDVSEQCLFFLYGTGANGKSTFISTILGMLGGYGRPGAPDLLFAQESSKHPADQADLQGARLVTTVEGEQGKRLAESTVKQITGGDTIKARFMGENFFEFRPTHKIWLASNHKPVIRGTDTGIWRRIKLIPFDVAIPEGKRDKHLAEKLALEIPGVLRWAVRGCLKWQEDGLKAPLDVSEATQSYRVESDTIGAFLEDACIVEKSVSCSAREVYEKYREWAEGEGEFVLSNRRLSTELRERGMTRYRSGGGQHRWCGLTLLPADG